MRGLKLSLVLGAGLALSGCSSIWSGVADIADFMAEKTSLRKSSANHEIVTADATPNHDGLIKSNAGYYAPASTHTTTTSAYSNPYSTQNSCPDGTYLTAENTCMMQNDQSYQGTNGYQMSELRGYSDPTSFHQTSSSYESTTSHSSLVFDYESQANTLTGPLICPTGMVLEGAYDCRFPDSGTRLLSQPEFFTPAKSYSYEYACPVGSYKDPENICMRLNTMP